MRNAESSARTSSSVAGTCDRPSPAIPHSAFRIPHWVRGGGVGGSANSTAPRGGPPPARVGSARRRISYDNARGGLEQAPAVVHALAQVVDRAAPEQPA